MAQTTVEEETKTRDETETPWNVVVHNDPVNLMSYVTRIFQLVFGFAKERAEKHMMMNAPGFAPAWEMAKSQAAASLQTEETGQSIPQRIFRKLLGSSSSGGASATADATSGNGSKNTDAGATAA